MTLLLAGDIGGTKTLLRLVRATEAGTNLDKLHEATYISADYPDLVPIVEKFLQSADLPEPEIACFAIAGPVLDNTSKLTNLNWFLTASRLEKDLNLKSVSLINDFAAVSYGILGLESKHLRTLQPGTHSKNAPIGVIGAGTGLGQGFLVPQGISHQVFATEGGHTDFAPRNELEFKLLQYLEKKYNIDHVSVERVVSGLGIVAIYQFLRDTHYAPENPEVAEVITAWEHHKDTPEKRIDPAATIAKAAIENGDPLSQKVLEMFIEAYAAEAGNLALKLLCYGGLYISGGIAPKLISVIEQSRFIEIFKQKGRMVHLLEQIPVHVVLNQQVGLLGSVLYALKG